MKLFANLYILLVYLKTLFFHKWEIIVAGIWINRIMNGSGFRVTWKRMLMHDFSKFSMAELWPYAQHFYGNTREIKVDTKFDDAWRHHYQHNDHHHEFFLDPQTNHSKLMPEDALMELVADWFAAGVAYDGKWPKNGHWVWVEKWFKKVTEKMHTVNVLFLIGILSILGFERCVMLSLYGDEKKRFDWNNALEKVKNEDIHLANRFISLHEHYNNKNKKQ